MEPKISVIVPVYNVEQYLERCVHSVLDQSFIDFELILVDDGSPDRCGQMCDDFAKKDCRVRVIHKKNGGQSDARNVGMDAASGLYIFFLDSDDYIESNTLETLLGIALRDDAQIVCGSIFNRYMHSSARQFPKDVEFQCTGREAMGYTLTGREITGSSCGKLIRTDFCRQYRFPLGKTYEDAFFMADIMPEAQRVSVSTQPFYHYWHRSGSTTTRPFSQRDMDVVEAYRYTLDRVISCCPELEEKALFRLHWANFVVMDRMMLLPNYSKLPQYRSVKQYLKNNWLKIARCPYFNKGRRLAAIILKINIKGYFFLSVANRKRTEENS